MPGLDIHVGIWLALSEAGITSDANAGTSAGAIVSAFDSAGMDASSVENILRGLADEDVRWERWLWKLRIPWIDFWLENDAISLLITNLLPRSFDDLCKPLSAHVTLDKTGSPFAFTSGDRLRQAVLASMSISGIFPPVSIYDDLYSDGGTTDNLPLPDGWTEYDEVWLLIASAPINYRKRGDGILSRLLWNMHMMCEDRIRDTVALARSQHPCVHVIRPPVRCFRGMLHFDHNLISEAYEWTRRYVDPSTREGDSLPFGAC